MNFTASWFLTVGVMLILAAVIGKRTRKSLTGVLVDSRERYSLNHFQVSLWTVLVLSTLVAGFVASGFDPSALRIPEPLLLLMGISVGTATASGTVKSVKDASPTTSVARAGTRLTPLSGASFEVRPQFAQVFLEEEGSKADQVVSITKFQNFLLTLIGVFAFVALALKTQGFPDLPQEFLWLIGIGDAGYVVGKVPTVA